MRLDGADERRIDARREQLLVHQDALHAHRGEGGDRLGSGQIRQRLGQLDVACRVVPAVAVDERLPVPRRRVHVERVVQRQRVRRRRRQLEGDQLRLGGEPGVDRRRPHRQPLHRQRTVGVLDHHQARRRHDQRRADPRPARRGARQAHRRQHAERQLHEDGEAGRRPQRAQDRDVLAGDREGQAVGAERHVPGHHEREAVGDRRGRRRRHQRGAGQDHRRDPGEQLGLPFALVRQDGAVDDAVRRHRQEAGRRGAVARRLLDRSLADPGPRVGVGLRVRHRHAGGDDRAGAQPDEGRPGQPAAARDQRRRRRRRRGRCARNTA